MTTNPSDQVKKHLSSTRVTVTNLTVRSQRGPDETTFTTVAHKGGDFTPRLSDKIAQILGSLPGHTTVSQLTLTAVRVQWSA